MTHIVPQNLPRDEAGEAIRARVFSVKTQTEAPGTAYQPLDSDLTAIAALSPANDDVIQRKAGAWTNRTMAQLAADIPVASLSGTKANFDAACSDGNFAYQSDLSSYLTTAAAATTYQPLDAQLTDLSGLSYGGNALKVVRVNAGETGWELATASGGVSDGDKGDVTVSGGGSTWTIDAGVVTLAKQADVATSTVFYRKTAGTGSPEVQTLATLKTDLGLTGTNSGDQTITLTGDVTGSGTGSFAATIANDAVTYAKMQNASANVVLTRADAASGNIGETALAASQLLGRGSTGNVAAITLGTNLSMSGTTLNATGGGSASITQIEQNLGSSPAYRGTFTVVDAAVSASSKIIIFQAPGPYTNKGTRADESDMDALRCVAVPASGQFTVRWEVDGHIADRAVAMQGQTRAQVTTAFNAADPPRLRMEAVRVGRVKGNFKFNYMVA